MRFATLARVAFENPPPDHDPFPENARRRLEEAQPRKPPRRSIFPSKRGKPRLGRKAILTTALFMTVVFVARVELRDAERRRHAQREAERIRNIRPFDAQRFATSDP